MEELLKSSVIKGLVFSAHAKFGPQPIYQFPAEVPDAEAEQTSDTDLIKLTHRDYIHMAIKNLSMILSDMSYKERPDSLNLPLFGIVPFPDFNLTSLTFYHFIDTNYSEKPVVSCFSILVHENQRSFLYNNINRLKSLIISFFYKFDKVIVDDFKELSEVEPLFHEFLLKVIEIEKKPFAPITSKRKMKILFVGLDNSGKTSFLLTVDRKYSKLIGLKPTLGAEVKSMEALGSTIFLWDLGGQEKSRFKYLEKSQIYLYETDLLFYFIDIQNRERFEESLEYFHNIKKKLEEFKQAPPILYLFSKGDLDIIDSDDIKDNIEFLKSQIINITNQEEPEIYITSIFSIFSILRAFSSGISKLSPNRELINLNLKNISIRSGANLSLLLNIDGLVLADYYSQDAITITDSPSMEEITDSDNLRNIFEITAPQFAILYKIFSKFKALHKDEAIFKIANSVILLKKMEIADFEMFILFLLDDEEKKIKINELLPDFLYRTSDLLLRYIA